VMCTPKKERKKVSGASASVTFICVQRSFLFSALLRTQI
jgi:hypothetical protein